MITLASVARVAGLGAILALTASCATLNESECMSADWAQLGRADGGAGRAESHINQHRSACERHNLPVDEQQWRTGWQDGIRFYCTAERGLLEGREGRYYANSCPLELKSAFEPAYAVGKRLHDVRASRERLESELRDLESRLRDADNDERRRDVRRQIDDKRSALYSADRRVHEAQREYELYVLTNNLSSR